ncbi:hypothetical protein [Agromyces sp. Root1464]|nr:hypothetical protein [Agromyces sp. Root1464]
MEFVPGYETKRPGVRDAAISDLREEPVRGFVAVIAPSASA